MIDKWVYPHFKASEFESPDSPASGYNMASSFMEKIESLRDFMGIPFHINSGFRTKAHNDAVDGGKKSAHLIGRAADIAWGNLSLPDKNKMLKKAWDLGFKGFGISQSFIHLDDVTTKDGYYRPSVWDYKTGHAGPAKLISLYPMVGEDGWPLT